MAKTFLLRHQSHRETALSNETLCSLIAVPDDGLHALDDLRCKFESRDDRDHETLSLRRKSCQHGARCTEKACRPTAA